MKALYIRAQQAETQEEASIIDAIQERSQAPKREVVLQDERKQMTQQLNDINTQIANLGSHVPPAKIQQLLARQKELVQEVQRLDSNLGHFYNHQLKLAAFLESKKPQVDRILQRQNVTLQLPSTQETIEENKTFQKELPVRNENLQRSVQQAQVITQTSSSAAQTQQAKTELQQASQVLTTTLDTNVTQFYLAKETFRNELQKIEEAKNKIAALNLEPEDNDFEQTPDYGEPFKNLQTKMIDLRDEYYRWQTEIYKGDTLSAENSRNNFVKPKIESVTDGIEKYRGVLPGVPDPSQPSPQNPSPPKNFTWDTNVMVKRFQVLSQILLHEKFIHDQLKLFVEFSEGVEMHYWIEELHEMAQGMTDVSLPSRFSKDESDYFLLGRDDAYHSIQQWTASRNYLSTEFDLKGLLMEFKMWAQFTKREMSRLRLLLGNIPKDKCTDADESWRLIHDFWMLYGPLQLKLLVKAITWKYGPDPLILQEETQIIDLKSSLNVLIEDVTKNWQSLGPLCSVTDIENAKQRIIRFETNIDNLLASLPNDTTISVAQQYITQTQQEIQQIKTKAHAQIKEQRRICNQVNKASCDANVARLERVVKQADRLLVEMPFWVEQQAVNENLMFAGVEVKAPPETIVKADAAAQAAAQAQFTSKADAAAQADAVAKANAAAQAAAKAQAATQTQTLAQADAATKAADAAKAAAQAQAGVITQADASAKAADAAQAAAQAQLAAQADAAAKANALQKATDAAQAAQKAQDAGQADLKAQTDAAQKAAQADAAAKAAVKGPKPQKLTKAECETIFAGVTGAYKDSFINQCEKTCYTATDEPCTEMRNMATYECKGKEIEKGLKKGDQVQYKGQCEAFTECDDYDTCKSAYARLVKAVPHSNPAIAIPVIVPEETEEEVKAPQPPTEEGGGPAAPPFEEGEGPAAPPFEEGEGPSAPPFGGPGAGPILAKPKPKIAAVTEEPTSKCQVSRKIVSWPKDGDCDKTFKEDLIAKRICNNLKSKAIEDCKEDPTCLENVDDQMLDKLKQSGIREVIIGAKSELEVKKPADKSCVAFFKNENAKKFCDIVVAQEQARCEDAEDKKTEAACKANLDANIQKAIIESGIQEVYMVQDARKSYKPENTMDPRKKDVRALESCDTIPEFTVRVKAFCEKEENEALCTELKTLKAKAIDCVKTCDELTNIAWDPKIVCPKIFPLSKSRPAITQMFQTECETQCVTDNHESCKRMQDILNCKGLTDKTLKDQCKALTCTDFKDCDDKFQGWQDIQKQKNEEDRKKREEEAEKLRVEREAKAKQELDDKIAKIDKEMETATGAKLKKLQEQKAILLTPKQSFAERKAQAEASIILKPKS